jgi:parallel beta-helix repeat protein
MDAMNALVQFTPRHCIHKEVDMITHRNSRFVWLRAVAALLGALSALLLVAGVAPAHASHIFCGATLGPGTHFLESDLGPCPVGFPALILKSATLNLNEFAIRCDASTGSSVGILVQGSESWLGNGIVDGCTYGVVLAGSGGHTVTTVVAIGNTNGDGFTVSPKSKENTLVANVAMQNYNGFAIWGSNNCLTGNAATANLNNGFVVRGSGSKNRLNNNGAVNNDGDGFDIEGSNNVVAGNRASENGDDGFDVAGQKNVLAGNMADANFGGGLEAEGSSNQFYGNTAGLNGAAGFEVYGGKNTLSGNTAEANAAGGFLVVGGQNALIANKSSENEGFGFQIVGSKNSIDGSLAMGNGGNGFEGYGNKNSFTDSLAGGNGQNGIVLAFGAIKNYVGQNTVGGDLGYDLKDENPFCSNEWFHNLSESSFQICD